MTPTERGIIHARISIYKSSPPRRGAGVAEQGCLLSSYPGKTGIGGSNPPLSAINKYTQIQPGLREIALSVVTSKLGMSRRMLTTFDPKIVRIFSRAYSENQLNPEISSFRPILVPWRSQSLSHFRLV